MENQRNNSLNSFQGFKKFYLLSSAGKLFLLLVIVPFIGQFVLMSIVMSTRDPKLIFMIMPLIMLIFMALFISWFYTLGTGLYYKLPQGNNLNVKFFKFNLIYTIIYSIVFMVNFGFGGIVNFGLLFLFHLYAMFGIFYGLYFISKTLVSVEKQQIAKFGDYFDVLFMFWFFPIGIWVLQPRIIKIFKQ
ncbi:hypothetical protein K8R66_04430 [bacterium]|nr:hypothetical protein [bacterium]